MPPDNDFGIDFTGTTLRAASVTGGAPVAPPPGAAAPRDQGAQAQAEGRLFFPLFQPPLASYRGGARYFGAPRSGGRLHAACDLLAPFGTKIRAIADGIVLQAPYYFYEGTNALEVQHPGIGVVRYGEISIVKAVHLRAGDRVEAGDVIAYVGRLDSGSSMLHFELYSGKAQGGLTNRGNPPYQRRRDLINPSSLVDKLYQGTFGH
jgi:murein DD-endopeptidase MepM/ murein hydrolase activator NlpD